MPDLRIGDMPEVFQEVLSMPEVPEGLPCGECPFLIERAVGGIGCGLVVKLAGEKIPAAHSGVPEADYDRAVHSVVGGSAADAPDGCPTIPIFQQMRNPRPQRDVYVERGPEGYHPNC